MWKIFDLANLTLAQIDVNYLRESKIINTNQSIEDFMELSRRRVITIQVCSLKSLNPILPCFINNEFYILLDMVNIKNTLSRFKQNARNKITNINFLVELIN